MRAILIFHNCEGQSHKAMSTDHNFLRKRVEADLNRGPTAYQPNALPLGQTGSLTRISPVTIAVLVAHTCGSGKCLRLTLLHVHIFDLGHERYELMLPEVQAHRDR